MRQLTTFTRSSWCLTGHPKWKYELVQSYSIELPEIATLAAGGFRCGEYLSYSKTLARLKIHRGYAWDGASGAIDTPDWMQASLVHDALCQAINEGYLRPFWPAWKIAADVMTQLNLADGMWRLRAWWSKRGVLLHGRLRARRLKESS